ncbi:MAG: polyribonucleotide nucleotidyltransferase [Gemmataceae bacterium]|nr:polyribonucleotide nucleotidyltransferase [Gemmataceae bacterium]MDW8266013.1 polyribonucleotide nucleotidyltransferase [Gemmataceae bacterium]
MSCTLGNQQLSIETGKLAKQAHGAVVVQYGDTVALVTAVEGEADEQRDFFPLVVDYREKTYAAGKFPGGFIKREGRPTTKEILTSRLIDRPLRPLFPPSYTNEVQIMASVLSFDKENDPDILSMIGSSAALHISHIPFLKPTGSVRIGRINNELIVMPTHSQLEESELDLVVSGTREAIIMIEGFAREMSEENMVQAIMFGHQQIQRIIDLIEELRDKAGFGPKEFPPPPPPNPLIDVFRTKYMAELRERKQTLGKHERAEKVRELRERVFAETLPEGQESPFTPEQVAEAFDALEHRVVRDLILEGKRVDGRNPKQLRPIFCEVGVLPRTHGSAIFQRGETQALVSTTLGTVSDEQRVDGLVDEYSKKFMLDYNFPPFSVGECRPIRGPGRREIGHGALAERSLKAVIPNPAKFPYTIRVVSDILESNGSSSMASVCGGTLSLMDAGVPISDPVAGISIGLVKEEDRYILLTDIVGDEDHFGDMDFKVAGTGRGVTGIQLDLKIDGIGEEIIRATLEQAREARREILRHMLLTLRQPRSEPSRLAPRIIQIRINPEKIGLLIGPGGKTIKGIQEATGAKIDVEDDGTVCIAHTDAAGAEAARARVEAITEEVRVGKVYEGKVTSIKDFGAFIEILPGRDGLCHISELDDKYVDKVENVCKIGDKLQVKVIAIDDQDRVKLSRKALLREQAAARASAAEAPPARRDSGGDRRRRNGGDDRR